MGFCRSMICFSSASSSPFSGRDNHLMSSHCSCPLADLFDYLCCLYVRLILSVSVICRSEAGAIGMHRIFLTDSLGNRYIASSSFFIPRYDPEQPNATTRIPWSLVEHFAIGSYGCWNVEKNWLHKQSATVKWHVCPFESVWLLILEKKEIWLGFCASEISLRQTLLALAKRAQPLDSSSSFSPSISFLAGAKTVMVEKNCLSVFTNWAVPIEPTKRYHFARCFERFGRLQEWCRRNFRRFGRKPRFHESEQNLTLLFRATGRVRLGQFFSITLQ